jgi:archaeal flagellin FlaB
MFKKRGEMGIGTLILFIASLVVSAIVAGVFIQTANSLQSKALLVGQRAVQQVSTAVNVINIVGLNGSQGQLTEFRYEIKLAAGSDALDLGDAFLSFETHNTTIDLKYRAGDCIKNTGYISYSETNSGFFTVEYLQEGTNYRVGYLNRGDVIRICFESTTGIEEDEAVTIMFKPNVGFTKTTTFMVNSMLTNYREHLYP